MKFSSFIIVLFFVSLETIAQNSHRSSQRSSLVDLSDSPRSNSSISKPPLDTSAFNNWLSISENPSLSNDGAYVLYKTHINYNDPATTIVKSINGCWQIQLPNVENAFFTENSRLVVYMQGKDSLCLLTLGHSFIEYIPKVRTFMMLRRGSKEWLLYHMNTTDSKLVLRDILTGREVFLNNVVDFKFSDNESGIILQRFVKNGSDTVFSMNWINLQNEKLTTVWQGIQPRNFIFDPAGDQLVFMTENEDSKIEPVDWHNLKALKKSFIWYYQAGMENARRVIINFSVDTERSLMVDRVLSFNANYTSVIVELEERQRRVVNPSIVKVDIWSYNDTIIQSRQLEQMYPEKFEAIVRIIDGNVVYMPKITESGNRIISLNNRNDSDDFVLVDSKKGDFSESNWSKGSLTCFYLSSVKTQRKSRIELNNISFSPDGKWLIGYKPNSWELCSYEIATSQIVNISQAVPIPIEIDGLFNKTKGVFYVAWILGTKMSLLVHDNFDLWKVDPSGENTPINLTNGFGRKNNILFNIVNKDDYLKGINEDEFPLLHAFNGTNKDQGFYRISKKGINPELLTMGPYDYTSLYLPSIVVVKAKDAEVYLIRRSNSKESPNYYQTRDFKRFKNLSHVFPERAYNWLTNELIEFKTLNGHSCQGIIYKPENFDSSKKYPVILHYYERKSQKLNQYQDLFGNDDNMDFSIPWFVSHGYIVVTPDINYILKKIGESALNSILGVTNYLNKFNYVDSNLIGLQGESFGGFETNYIVTHSNRFVAAISSCGISNLVSFYGSGPGKEGYFENGQGRMRETLWQNPTDYIKNSPIFNIDKVSTPLLIVANNDDANASFSQGLELFLALRRLGKIAWMLQYDGESHGLGGKAFIDFILRSQQFFDHYLKGAPAPKWMVEGVPAKLKGIDSGFELEPLGVEPSPGLPIEEKLKK